MTDLQIAAEMAVKALERADKISGFPNNKKTLTALREALSSSKDSSALAKPVERSTAKRELFAVPPGYVLVPVVATPEMVRAYRSKHVGGGFNDEAYLAMLAAAPPPFISDSLAQPKEVP